MEILQINVGRRCSISCRHCHLECSPDRTEIMDWSTMERILKILKDVSCNLVDITGGSPELHPDLRKFIKGVRDLGIDVQVRTNLTCLLEPEADGMMEFFRENALRLVGSMPCYLEENVDAQRGTGVYERNIEVIGKLNSIGYGAEGGLQLNLAYNPGGPFLAAEQSELEAAYRKELDKRFGLKFTNLLTITNMPIGRFRHELEKTGKFGEYMNILIEAFNPEVVRNLMCRHQVCVDWNGNLYDCDFNVAMGLTINHGAPNRIEEFDIEVLKPRRIVTGEHCFGCTAGAGSSCKGALK